MPSNQIYITFDLKLLYPPANWPKNDSKNEINGKEQKLWKKTQGRGGPFFIHFLKLIFASKKWYSKYYQYTN